MAPSKARPPDDMPSEDPPTNQEGDDYESVLLNLTKVPLDELFALADANGDAFSRATARLIADAEDPDGAISSWSSFADR